MDIKHLQQRLAVPDGRVVGKANELLRLAAVKVPPGTLRQVHVKCGMMHGRASRASLAAAEAEQRTDKVCHSRQIHPPEMCRDDCREKWRGQPSVLNWHAQRECLQSLHRLAGQLRGCIAFVSQNKALP